jgi:hypothetical protein
MVRVAAHIAEGSRENERGDWSERAPAAHRDRQEPRAVAFLRQLHGDEHDAHGDLARDEAYHLTIAFPALRRSPPAWPGGLRLADDSARTAVELRALVDDASAADERRERMGVAARAIARAATKYALTKAVKDRKGELAGQLANVGTGLLERADVRSWHLLPQEIAILRLPMAQGTREVRLQVREGTGARVVSLGAITVQAGEVTIAPIRLWHNGLPTAVRPSTLAAVPEDSGCVALVCR